MIQIGGINLKFCAKCGTKLEQDVCPQCGYSLSSRQDEVIKEDTNVVQAVNNDYPKNNEFTVKALPTRKSLTLSMGAKIGILAVTIVTVLLIGIFIVGNSLSKPSKVVSKFQKAVASGNKADLSDVLYCDDNRMKISEKTISPLLNYFKENPSYLNTVVSNLNNEAARAEQSSALAEISGKNNQGILTLRYTGKKFLFFPSYKIVIQPAFIDVKAEIKGVTFSLNGTEMGKSDVDKYNKEFGPYIPGKYNLSANYKGKYVTLSEPQDVDLISASNCKANVDVLTNLNYIKVGSEYPDAEIFVNGKDAGIKAVDADNFGPLNSSTKVYAVYTKDGKTLKSSEYTVSEGDTDIYLSFTEAENQIKNTENQIHDLIYWYTNYFTEAVNNNDFASVEGYIYPGSKLYDEQKSYISTTYNQGIKETIMSFNVISCNLNDDNKSGTVTTEEVYNIDNKDNNSVKTFKYKYTFKYNEEKGMYQLDSIVNNQ